MTKATDCINCGMLIFSDEEDPLCYKCEENEKLRNRLFLLEQHQAIIFKQSEKLMRYEKALKECIEQNGLMDFLDENDWATSEDYFVKLAKEALYK